jgi:hypothetical protein
MTSSAGVAAGVAPGTGSDVVVVPPPAVVRVVVRRVAEDAGGSATNLLAARAVSKATGMITLSVTRLVGGSFVTGWSDEN